MSNSEYREAQQQAREHGLKARHEQRLENATYTAAEVKVLTEAALRLGRKEALEDFAARCRRRAQLAERVPEPVRSGVREGMIVTWLAAERLAHETAEAASSARTDLSVDTDLSPEPQAASNRLPDECPEVWVDTPDDVSYSAGQHWETIDIEFVDDAQHSQTARETL